MGLPPWQPRTASTPHGAGEAMAHQSPCTPSKVRTLAGRVLLWSRPGKIATLVAPFYPFFYSTKKKKKGVYLFSSPTKRPLDESVISIKYLSNIHV